MHARVTDHAAIIELLGGWRVLAGHLDVDPVTTWRWRRNGIPMSRWNAIIAIAKQADMSLTFEQLDAGRPIITPVDGRTERRGRKRKPHTAKRAAKGSRKRKAS